MFILQSVIGRIKFSWGNSGDLSEPRHQGRAWQGHARFPAVDRHPGNLHFRPEILLRLLRILAFSIGGKGMGDLGHAKSYTENVTLGQPHLVSRETYSAQ